VVIPPVMRICATSNGEQRFQVLILVVQGLSQKQRQLMQKYLEVVDWQGLELPSVKRRQRDSLYKNQRSVEVWRDWIRIKKELATLGEELLLVELLSAERKQQSPDPTKIDASRKEFGHIILALEIIIDLPSGFPINNIISLAGGNMWKSLSCLLTIMEVLTKTIQRRGQKVWRGKFIKRR